MGTRGDAIEVCRPLIDYNGKEITHSGRYCRVVLQRGKISVGCSDVTPDALRHLLMEYEAHFSDKYILQP